MKDIGNTIPQKGIPKVWERRTVWRKDVPRYHYYFNVTLWNKAWDIEETRLFSVGKNEPIPIEEAARILKDHFPSALHTGFPRILHIAFSHAEEWIYEDEVPEKPANT